jgi:hypothetical protein
MDHSGVLPEIPSSNFDTLYAEFQNRMRPSSGQSWSSFNTLPNEVHSRGLLRDLRRLSCAEPSVDLRSVEYVSSYEPHLMCPICHVPFINPIVLECDHCFCARCFVQSCERGSNPNDTTNCPSCRAPITTKLHKASRIIVNMCDDIRVQCPNKDCSEVMARGHVEHHARKQCPHELVKCSGYRTCEKLIKRKYFRHGECFHDSILDCDCGRQISGSDAELQEHKEQECSEYGRECEICQQRLPDNSYLAGTEHICKSVLQSCPGEEYGCAGYHDGDEIDAHTKTCTFARLVPSLKAQASLLADMKSELVWTKSRNEILESGFERLQSVIGQANLHTTIPMSSDAEGGQSNEIVLSSTNRSFERLDDHRSNNSYGATVDSNSIHHLTLIHDGLRASFSNLESDVGNLSGQLADMDARVSMHIMNETLRIKEDLAHTNAALFSTRAQVQWLLNRERTGQQIAMRGRAPAGTSASTASTSATPSSGSMASVPSSEGPGEQSTESTMTTRPIRRPSGGSQERVKL